MQIMETTVPAAVERLAGSRALARVAESLRAAPAAVAVSGLWGSALSAVTAALEKHLGRPMLVICGHVDEADDIADDMELFHGRRPEVLPALEVVGELRTVSEEQAANRLALVDRLASGGAGASAPVHIVASIQALMQAVPARSQIRELSRTLAPGQQIGQEQLISWLVEHGYNRLEQVEMPGDFAVRGGIVDIYLPGDFEESGEEVGLPVRLDFFGDRIESIRRFDMESLGSRQPLSSVRITDLRGEVGDIENATSLFSYVPDDAVVVFWAGQEIAEQARSYYDRLVNVRGVYPLADVVRLSQRFARLELGMFEQPVFVASGDAQSPSAEAITLPFRSLQRFEGDSARALAELHELSRTHDVAVLCDNVGEVQRLVELVDAHHPGLRQRISISTGHMHHGFVWAGDSDGERPLALVPHHELFNRYEVRRRPRKVIESRPIDSFLDLRVGDYVVHVAHGIARFAGMQTVARDGRTEEYLTLRFADDAVLHVPATHINLVQKYIGGFRGRPRLSRLGTTTWAKEKARVTEAVEDMAAELLEIQAARAAQPGIAYPPDSDFQKQFEAEFPYEPTPDQVQAAAEIKQDMEKPRPMDRLLCGDVGYGKTELAMRAAFKAVENNKQVAVLVPTTVLAEQHYRSFRERMADYPVEIECISRFKTRRQQREILKRAREGRIDVLIGTHRLLSADVAFRALGLVIVDEEQRFGVAHKEQLKKLRRTVDVLTMSATPIPRTLHMGLIGLRDISSLTTPPQDRRSVVTEVIPYDTQRIRQAILRELNRDGQVYFVHNRVKEGGGGDWFGGRQTIDEVAARIQMLVPEARVVVGHGQMGERELEEVMLKFLRHEADILVCTTIIESGLDIPNANTIFINEADMFGLSQLHQLRGRVGRWKHRAYCYLVLPPRPLRENAAKRLKAIEEYSHLGAGFKIAMRDLEIRGAGNILGPEQSGHIATVGYELYCQMLEEAARRLRNEPPPLRADAHVDIGVSTAIPRSYIPSERQRMDAYRRLTRCTRIEEVQRVVRDIADAHGPAPEELKVLAALMELRLLAGYFGIESIVRQEPDVVIKMASAERVQKALAGAPGRLSVVDEETLYYRPPPSYMKPETLLLVLRNLAHAAWQRETSGAAAPAAPAAPRQKVEPPVEAAAAAAAPAAPLQKVEPSVEAAAAAAAPAAPRQKVEPPVEPRAAAAAPASSGRQRQSADTEALLQMLLRLRRQGVLSEEEYQSARRRVMEKSDTRGAAEG